MSPDTARSQTMNACKPSFWQITRRSIGGQAFASRPISNQWEILVALGKNGAPEHLADNIDYEIHAWWPKKPEETSAHFPFDPGGPQPSQ